MDNEIRWARKRFAAMAVTYFLGVFNDNYFKQAVLLLAVGVGMSDLQGRATELFSLPFVLFSAWGGWLADRLAKRRVVIGAKVLELAAMLVGAWGIVTLNWDCVLTMIFLMGLQSTLFGPALNGSIPELYPDWYVTRANSLLKMVTTVAILAGMALAGFTLDLDLFPLAIPFGRAAVAAVVVLVALLGVFSSLGVYSRPAAATGRPFPWAGPLGSIRDLSALRRDPLLLTAVVLDAYFYFVSLLAVLVINTLGIEQLGLSRSATSLLSVSLMVGVCLGAVLAARLTTTSRWTHVLVPALLGMSVCLAASGGLAIRGGAVLYWPLLLLLLLTGACGGLFLIPVTSFLQVRPAPDNRGRTIAAANFLGFSCMWFSGRLYSLLDPLFSPAWLLVLLAGGVALSSPVLALVLRHDRAASSQPGTHREVKS